MSLQVSHVTWLVPTCIHLLNNFSSRSRPSGTMYRCRWGACCLTLDLPLFAKQNTLVPQPYKPSFWSKKQGWTPTATHLELSVNEYDHILWKDYFSLEIGSLRLRKNSKTSSTKSIHSNVHCISVSANWCINIQFNHASSATPTAVPKLHVCTL